MSLGMDMLLRIWEQNKKFLLVAGAGLAVFLLLNSCVSGFAGHLYGPAGLHAQSAGLERDIRRLHRELTRFAEVRSSLGDYEREEKALRAELEPSRAPELEKFDEAAPLLQFERAIDRVWGQALERANRANVLLPEKLSPGDFGVGRQDGRQQYERHYGYLGIIQRALGAAVGAGMIQIGRPELVEPDVLPILPEDDSAYVLYRAVRLQVDGPFPSFLRLLETAHTAGDLLQVRVVDLRPRGRDDQEILRGELNFVSFQLVDRSYFGESEPGRTPLRRGRLGPRR